MEPQLDPKNACSMESTSEPTSSVAASMSTSTSTAAKANSRQLKIRALQEGDELRRLRYAKMRGGMPMSSALNLVVMGTGAPGSPASILINGDHVNYLINCGESVQRILVEHSLRLSKVEHVFCTSKSWRNVGGLLGMFLTLQQAGVPSITLHGDAECLRLVRVHGGYADDRFNDSELRHHDHSTAGLFEDANFLVRTVQLKAFEGLAEQSRVLGSTYLFVFQPKLAPPNVDMSRCDELGMSKSDRRLIKDLKEHFDDPTFTVTLDNGSVVRPVDICKPQLRCGPIVIFECPSMDYLNRLIIVGNAEMQLEEEQSPAKKIKLDGDWSGHVFSEHCSRQVPALVVHMTHFRVAEQPEYLQFMHSFPQETQHLVLDGSCTAPACVGVYRNQAIMHLAHPHIFPLLSISSSDESSDAQRVTIARPGLRFQIRPKPAFNDSECLRVSYEEFVAEAFSKNEELKAVADSLAPLQVSTESYPRIVFLGTGSSVPSKTRNVSAFIVETDLESCLLFDCGEGTYAQLVRHYGNETDAVLRRLRAVLISHMHADHHGGLFTMLTEWFRANGLGSQLSLIAPQRIAHWLRVYVDNVLDHDNSLLQHVQLVPSHLLCPLDWRPKGAAASAQSDDTLNESRVSEMLAKCGLQSLVAVPVLHSCQPYGYVVKLSNGTKLVYSGDTMPCDRLVEAGLDCDVLVHEATMEDDLHDEARAKRHSTIGQAVDVAKRMRARYCILTHFSQRYSKIPPVYSNAQLFDESGSEDNMQIGVAFDHMRVSLTDISFFRHLLPFLKCAFPDCFKVMASNLEKRTNKKLRALNEPVPVDSSV